MKRDRMLHTLTAAVLAFCLAFGGVGCMVTGLKLEVSSLWLLALACAGAAVFGALCFSGKGGTWCALGALVLGCLLFSKDSTRLTVYMDQTRAMLHRMTTLWNYAYGWPRIALGEETLCDLPLILIGSTVALTAVWTLCRRKRAAVLTAISLLPLVSCLVVTDTVPDTAFLFLLLLAVAVVLLTNSVRRKNLRQGLELTAMAALAAAVSLGLLLGLNPRESYVNKTEEVQEAILTWAQDLPARIKEWGQENAPGSAQAVQTQRENLATLGRRIERDTRVLEVTSELSGRIYLRGQDFDSYDGKTWTATKNRQEAFSVDGAMPGSQWGKVTVDALRVRSVLYVPYYAQPEITFTGGRLSNEADQTEYTFQQVRLPHNWKDLLKKTPELDEGYYVTGLYGDAKDTWRYRNLPLETQAKAKKLVNQILTDEQSNTEKADAIADYVRGSAVYSLDPGTMPSDEADFALWFLEDQDAGYCVHFATATAVLLRAAGIDARYVTGYVLQAQAGQKVTVRAKQAHAWVEYFEPRLNTWIVLESTPAEFANWDDTTPVEAETTAPTETNDPTRPSVPEETEEPEAGTDPFIRFEEGPEKANPWTGLWKFLKKLLFPVLAAAVLWGQYRLRLSLRRKKQRSGHPNSRALALWREAVLLHRLLKTPIPEELEALAQRAKFSQHTISPEQLAHLEDGAAWAANRLQEKPWYLRLVYRLVFAAF